MRKLLFLILVFANITTLFAQSGMQIKGRVIDKDTQETLIGVAVVLKSNPSVGTITDMDGNFVIQVPNASTELSVSYVGYETMTVVATQSMTIKLGTSTQGLGEVVVIGYGSVRKSDLTGSVSSIKSKDLTTISTANVQSSMAGRAAGVQVVSSGSVDGATKVRIRGIGTINNSDPLYVVDGFSTNDISYLAPSDIQSMEILKDASATAIYGSRGANGVVLITTKKGLNQPTTVSFNAYSGVSNATKTMEVLDATDYAHARIEAYANGNMEMDPDDLAKLNYAIANNSRGTDWQKEVLRTGVVQNYNAAIVGGSDKVKYNLSTTYNSTEGILKNAFVNKLFVRLNTEYQLSKKIKFGSDISFVDYRSSMSDLSNMYAATLMLAARSAPVSPVYDQFGNWESNMSKDANPVRKSDQTQYDQKGGDKFVGNFYLNVDLIKGLSFRSTFGAAYSIDKQSNYIPTYYVSPQENISTSQLTENRSTNIDWIWSNVATYDFKLSEDHKLTAMLGTEASYNSYDGLNATAFDVAENANMRYISAAKSNNYQANSSQGVSTIFSTFVRANYSYKNRYLLTTTLRSDESSRFSEQNRQGIFPSLSLGWNLKEENFLKNNPTISQLKLRTGWGQVGNQSSTGIGDYLSTIANGKKYVLGGNVYEGRIPEYLSNPLLKWEVAQQSNVGLDLGLFNNQWTMTVDYFIKDTKDMIVRAPIPSYVGALAPLANVGSMRNNGFEFTTNYSGEVSGLKYNVGLNLSMISNKVTNLGGAAPIYVTLIDRLGATSITEVGHPIASYWGYQTAGVFHTQAEIDAYTYTDANSKQKPIQPTAEVGDVKYVSRHQGELGAEDQTFLGDYIPTLSGGFNFGLEYKNFTFSFFSDFNYGNKIANMNLYFLESSLGSNMLQSYYNNRWTPETPNNNEPRLTTSSQAAQNTLFSDRYIEDGSFLRIRNVQLGYNIPKSLLQRAKINSMRIYVSVDNLATFTKYSGYNPEISDQWGNPLSAGADVGSSALPRTITMGVNFKF